MIPVDIDNFIIGSINWYQDKSILIRGKINKIPKEIGNIISLRMLAFQYNKIVDISALSNCSSLESLALNNNKIIDISALSNLTSLTYLCIKGNKIIDMIKFNPTIYVDF